MNVRTCTDRPVLNACTLEGLNYQIDPYIGCAHYCYYCYALDQAETDWTEEILKYKDIGSQLSREIKDITPQRIYMGYHTDPYQPCEVECRQTRKVLELLLENGFSASVLTKSDLVVRDIDILKRMDNAAVSVSVAFNDNRTRRLFEDNTMATEKRIASLRRIKEAGVRTGVLLCPVIPYVTDAIQLIDMLQPYADVIWIYGLSVEDRSGKNWMNIREILKKQFPGSAERIEAAIFSKEDGYWVQLRKSLETIQKDRQLNLNIHL